MRFFFNKVSVETLTAAKLGETEIALALRIHKSSLYPSLLSECIALCNQLDGLYRWESNSEGSRIFASKILFLLRFKGEDVAWFSRRLRQARGEALPRRKKKRATVIVRTPHGTLLTEDYKGMLLLPGGQIERGELPIAAAARELHEETCLNARSLEFLFEHESQNYIHHVFRVNSYAGQLMPSSDALRLLFLSEQEYAGSKFPDRLTRSNVEILQRVRTLGLDL